MSGPCFKTLEALVSIASVSGQEQNMARYCETFLKTAGFEVTRQHLLNDYLVTDALQSESPRFNVLAQKGAGHLPTLLLYAHLDTVSADEAYTQDPFRVRYDFEHAQGPRAYGLGVSDMKSGLAVILDAVKHVEPQGYCLKVALGVDEEAFSMGAWQLKDSEWCRNVKLALVPELVIDSQTEQLGLGRSGLISLVLRCKGPRQHGAVPLDRPSAIENAILAIDYLKKFPLYQSQLSERLIVHGIQASIEGLTYPAFCDVKVSFFLSPERNASTLFADLTRYFQADFSEIVDISQVPRPTPVAQAYAVDTNHAAVHWLKAIYRNLYNKELPTAYGWSVADENVLQEAISGPVLSLAPVGGFSHRAGEWLCLQSFEHMVSLYKNILKEAGAHFA